jgi:hypothetical protein
VAFVLAATRGGAASAFGASAEKLDILADDFHATALLAAGFVLPGVHAKAAFDIERAAFFGVFAGDFSEAAPEFHINEGGLLTLLAVVEGVVAVDRQADIGHGATFRGEFYFGIAGDISDEDDFVDIGHGGASLGGLGRDGLSGLFRGEFQVILEHDLVVEGELGADSIDGGRLGAEDDIDEVGALEMAGLVGEIAFLEALDLLDGGSGGLDGFFEALDGFFDGFFFSARVEGEEGFVSVHGSWFLWLN